MRETSTIAVRINIEEHEALKRIGAKEDLTVSQMVRKAIKEYIINKEGKREEE